MFLVSKLELDLVSQRPLSYRRSTVGHILPSGFSGDEVSSSDKILCHLQSNIETFRSSNGCSLQWVKLKATCSGLALTISHHLRRDVQTHGIETKVRSQADRHVAHVQKTLVPDCGIQLTTLPCGQSAQS